MNHLRVALCQVNTVVGDLGGNVERILACLATAEEAGCDVAVFPELAITGYPPEDLLLKPGFVADNRQALEALASRTERCAAVVGFVDGGRELRNAAAVCSGGSVLGTYHKRRLPNYGVFDEKRYFTPGRGAPRLFLIGGVRVGVSICEDAWDPVGPIAEQAAGGAEIVVNLNASPYHAGRQGQRERMLAVRAADAACALVYVNQVGGQDELVFDGASLVLDADGSLLARAPQFSEHTMIVDLEQAPSFRRRLLDPRGREVRTVAEPESRSSGALPLTRVSDTPVSPVGEPRQRGTITPALEYVEEVYEALVLGTRDYVDKNDFSHVVVGLSGGVDSSLVATVATDALGPEWVHGVSMPSRFSSAGSKDDAAALARSLGIDLRTIPIEPAHAAVLAMLAPELGRRPPGVTEENVQSRIRGVVLMALSNEHGWLVLTTANKSEAAVGFSTLYGDTAGGFSVIKDVPKGLVYELCRHRNRRAGHDLIPEAVLAKAPSAELRPDQRDDESLPPYEALDPIVAAYVEADRTAAELAKGGFDPALVERVVRLVDRAEYKRRQSPPGVRVTPKAFGKDRRLPITNRYRG